MDVFFALAFAFGLVYVMVRAARWAFRLDVATKPWRKQERLSRRERNRTNAIFDTIVPFLKKEPKDD